MRRPSLVPVTLFVLAAPWFGACSDGGGSSSPRIRIDAGGGRIVATDGPLTGFGVEVPAGAVETPTTFDLAPIDVPTLPLDVLASGAAAQFGPLGVQFGRSVVAVLPLAEPDPLATSIAPQFVWLWQDDPLDGELVPFAVLRNGPRRGEVLLERTTRMVTVVTPDQPMLPIVDYVGPLDGVQATFDTGVTLTVAITSEEPNLVGRPIARCDFDGAGYYFSLDAAGQLLEHGFYDVIADFQQLDLVPTVRAAAFERRDGSRRELRSFQRFDRYGGAAPNSWGEQESTTRYRYRSRFETPLGTFRNLIELEFLDTDVFGVPQLVARFQLARGIGIVGYEFPRVRTVGRIVSGSIGDTPIRAR